MFSLANALDNKETEMAFALVKTQKGVEREFPISAFQLFQVGLYVMLENGQQLSLDRDKRTPRVRNLTSGKTMGLQTFINNHCTGGNHAV